MAATLTPRSVMDSKLEPPRPPTPMNATRRSVYGEGLVAEYLGGALDLGGPLGFLWPKASGPAPNIAAAAAVVCRKRRRDGRLGMGVFERGEGRVARGR